MTHLNDEQVQRLLHAESGANDEAAMRAHIAECPACAALVADAERDEREIHALLDSIDLPAPPLNVPVSASRGPARWPAWARRAAVFIGAAALAGAAYALPGSPLPGLLQRLTSAFGDPGVSPSATPAFAPPVTPSGGGMLFAPGTRFTIEFSGGTSADTVDVFIVDRESVEVTVPAGVAISTPSEDRVMVDARTGSPGTARRFGVAIPARAPRVEIFVGARRAYVRDAGTVSSQFAVDSAGRVRVPLVDGGT